MDGIVESEVVVRTTTPVLATLAPDDIPDETVDAVVAVTDRDRFPLLVRQTPWSSGR